MGANSSPESYFQWGTIFLFLGNILNCDLDRVGSCLSSLSIVFETSTLSTVFTAYIGYYMNIFSYVIGYMFLWTPFIKSSINSLFLFSSISIFFWWAKCAHWIILPSAFSRFKRGNIYSFKNAFSFLCPIFSIWMASFFWLWYDLKFVFFFRIFFFLHRFFYLDHEFHT